MAELNSPELAELSILVRERNAIEVRIGRMLDRPTGVRDTLERGAVLIPVRRVGERCSHVGLECVGIAMSEVDELRARCRGPGGVLEVVESRQEYRKVGLSQGDRRLVSLTNRRISYDEVPVDACHHLSRDHGSGVVCCFLDELYAGGQAELGVDVGEVSLHRPR